MQAAVLTNIYDVYMSIEKCGIPQTNPLFTTYGFALDESTCGAVRMGMSLIVTVDIVMITVLRMFL